MSLCGNLSDLSLTELLQIIALARKSGLLEVCSEDHGAALLGLREGGIVRIALLDQDLDRDAILKREGLDRAEPDVAEAHLWDAAVGAILSLFDWKEGDFTFDVAPDPTALWRGPDGLVLPSALSPEFLALEGARLEDESGLRPAAPQPRPVAPHTRPVERRVPSVVVARRSAPPVAPPKPLPARPSVIVCIDPRLDLLERMKAALGRGGVRVHVFQTPNDGLARLMHYLVRGEFPLVIIGSDIPVAPAGSEGPGWKNFVRRTRRMAPTLKLLLLARPGVDGGRLVDAQIDCPDVDCASPAELTAFLDSLAGAVGLGT